MANEETGGAARRKPGRKKGTPKTGGRTTGAAKTGGRQKGTQNKLTVSVKAMIRGALDDAGGQDYLLRQANKENSSPFMALVAKLVPTEIGSDPDHPVVFEIRQTIVRP